MTGIMADDLGIVWKDAERLLEPALLGECGTDVVLTQLMSGHAQLWIAATGEEMQAACVTQVYYRHGKKLCNLWLAGGKGINNWLHFMETIEEWAKEKECDELVIDEGRPGWQRLFKDWKVKSIRLGKVL